jgi:Clr5 domain
MVEPAVAVYITKPTEWEYLRPIITNLYMGERWELPQIMKEIETKYGFKATLVYGTEKCLRHLQLFLGRECTKQDLKPGVFERTIDVMRWRLS